MVKKYTASLEPEKNQIKMTTICLTLWRAFGGEILYFLHWFTSEHLTSGYSWMHDVVRWIIHEYSVKVEWRGSLNYSPLIGEWWMTIRYDQPRGDKAQPERPQQEDNRGMNENY